MKTWSKAASTACVLALCVFPMSAGQEKRTEETSNPVSTSSRKGANLRPITLSDLLTIRDCKGVSISPDGKYVAFVTGQAVYETNDYRSRLFVVSIKPGSVPVDLGSAGLPHWDSINQYAEEAPQWSPDSSFIMYRMRKLVTETWQVWRWNRKGGTPVQLTQVPGDVIEYHGTLDGSRLIMTVEQSRDPKEIVQLSEHGIVYDGKVDAWKSLPIVREVLARRSTPTETWIYEFSKSKERLANQQETSFFGPWISDLDEQVFDEKQETFQGHHITDAQKSPDGQWVAYRYLVDDLSPAKSFEISCSPSLPVEGGPSSWHLAREASTSASIGGAKTAITYISQSLHRTATQQG